MAELAASKLSLSQRQPLRNSGLPKAIEKS